MSYNELVATANRLRRADRAKQALPYYQKAAAIKATAAIHSGMGYCYFDLGNFQGALDHFKKAIRNNSREQGALIGLAMAYEELGNKSNAKKYYQKYLDYYPAGPDAVVAKNAIKRL